jgi:hypothetical protein
MLALLCVLEFDWFGVWSLHAYDPRAAPSSEHFVNAASLALHVRSYVYRPDYYYKYTQTNYSIIIGVPVGISLCVLLVCLAICCQQRKQKLQKELEKEEATKLQDESDAYHAMSDVVGSKSDGAAGSSSNSAAGAGAGSPSPARAVISSGLSRYEQIGGDWVGYASRASGGEPLPDSIFFQIRGMMAVGAHRDRMGSYTLDGTINTREKALCFSKTYATSSAHTEYKFKLWDEVRRHKDDGGDGQTV